jgi:permuted papain-like amidase YaeF/Yiix C92 family enzyme
LQRTVAGARFADDYRRIEALALRPAASADELARNLGEVYRAVFNIDLARYDAAQVREHAHDFARAVFKLRVRLRDAIGAWHARGLIDTASERALRDVFRVARYGADMLGELAIGHARVARGGAIFRAFTAPQDNTLVHPAYASGRDLAFRSGDVLLVRGMLHNSAAIARIGDVDTQFSHVALVHVDGDGRHWAMESLIEDGAVVAPLEFVLGHGVGRAVVYRHRDSALAADASARMYDRVQRAMRGEIPPIRYDFSMELGGSQDMYCSKLVRAAFEEASGGRLLLPTFTTLLDMRNRDFLDRIGVTARETFAPGDIDLEPDFDLVAEWQDYRVTSDLRLQDMVMTKLLEWMEYRDLRFRESVKVQALSLLGRVSSRMPGLTKHIARGLPKVPANMSREAIATVAMLHKTAEPLYRRMQVLERQSIAKTGRGLHPREVLDALERMREAAGDRIGYLAPPG